ncbi:hypothetical protein BGZ49_002118 [Haplosporangium sp. Z 27]|nr:hypothetical protein BGZ49_002118 [Haplosporangium sp. Z 27]
MDSNRADIKSKSLPPLNDEVQESFDELSELVMKEDWESKARFPTNLRAPLFKCAKIALDTRSTGYVIEENFFAHLQNLLPYNRFTLKKLVYKNILPQWSMELEDHLKTMIQAFKKRVEADGVSSGLTVDNKSNQDSNDAAEPKPSFLWTQGLRLLLWETMEKYLEIASVSKELSIVDPITYEQQSGSEEQVVERAYVKILSCFPENWMTTQEIATQYMKLKEKIVNQEKEDKKVQVIEPKKLQLKEQKQMGTSSSSTRTSVFKFQEPMVADIGTSGSQKTDASHPVPPMSSSTSGTSSASRELQFRHMNVAESGHLSGYIKYKDEVSASEKTCLSFTYIHIASKEIIFWQHNTRFNSSAPINSFDTTTISHLSTGA